MKLSRLLFWRKKPLASLPRHPRPQTQLAPLTSMTVREALAEEHLRDAGMASQVKRQIEDRRSRLAAEEVERGRRSREVADSEAQQSFLASNMLYNSHVHRDSQAWAIPTAPSPASCEPVSSSESYSFSSSSSSSDTSSSSSDSGSSSCSSD
jgi:hypothetical protein